MGKEMKMISLQVKNSEGKVLDAKEGGAIAFEYNGTYGEGDHIVLTATEGKYLVIRLDEALNECMIYLPSGSMTYAIPFGEKLNAYGKESFSGDSHKIAVRYAAEEEIYAYRNVAINSHDKRGIDVCYPHALANFVTRDESTFEERNAIDGYTLNDSHGNFPYQSWGGGAREDVDFKLFFGRPVEADKLVFYLRADYKDDHDTYWKSLTVELSDGTEIVAEFDRTGAPQEVSLGGKRTIEWVRLKNFKQAANPLTWAALTEIEVYGNDVKN